MMADFGVSTNGKDVNVKQFPSLSEADVTWGATSPTTVAMVPYTCANGGQGYSVSMVAASSYSAASWPSQASTWRSLGAIGGGLGGLVVGGIIGFFGGPFAAVTVLAGAVNGATIGVVFGGVVGVLYGTREWLTDFSNWSSPITINYTVCACPCGKRIQTLNENALIPGTGNSDVAAIGSSMVYGCGGEGWFHWGRNIQASDLQKGTKEAWKQANISTKHGFNFAQTFMSPDEHGQIV
jgi:hypothetical protein